MKNHGTIVFAILLLSANSILGQTKTTSATVDARVAVVGVVLDGKSNNLLINGTNIGSARVYGRQDLLMELLWSSDNKLVKIETACHCRLTNGGGECVFDFLPKAKKSDFANKHSDRIVIILSSNQFIKVAVDASKSLVGSGGNNGGRGAGRGNNGRNGSNPPDKDPTIDQKRSDNIETVEQDKCKLVAEICFNTKGETSFSLGCDGKFKFEIATNGEIKMSLSNKQGQSFSVPLKPSN